MYTWIVLFFFFFLVLTVCCWKVNSESNWSQETIFNMIFIRWFTFRILFIFLFPWIVHTSFIHNLDVRKERVFTSLTNSYFGYSLSAHRSTEAPAEYISQFYYAYFVSEATKIVLNFPCVGLSLVDGWLGRQVKMRFRERFINVILTSKLGFFAKN